MSESLHARKSVVIGLLAFVSFLALTLLILPGTPVFAAQSIGDAIKELITNLVQDILGVIGIKKDFLSQYTDIMLGRNSGYMDAVTGPNGVGTKVMDTVKVLSGSFIMLYTVLDIIKRSERFEPSIDLFAAPLMKMTIAVVAVIFLDDIMGYLEDAGEILVDQIQTTVSNAVIGYETDTLEDITSLGGKLDVGKIGLWSAVPIILTITTVMNPIMKLVELSVKLLSYGLFFELAIRKTFAPIAIAGIVSNEGPMSPGVAYMKRYFGVYMKMAICVFAVGLSYLLPVVTKLDRLSDLTKISIKNLGDVGFLWRGIGTSLCCRSAAVAVFRNGSKYVDEILGVR